MSPAQRTTPPRDAAAHDSTLSPAAFERALKASGAGIAVLSTDPAFIETVWDVGHEHPSLVVADDWPGLLDAVVRGFCNIVVLDVDQLGDDLNRRLAELERCNPPPVVVAAGENRRAPEMMRMHAERRIHRLLVKPATPGKLQLLLGAALTHSRRPRELENPPEPAGPSYRAPREAAAGGMRRRMVTLAVGMAVVFAAVVAVGLGWKSQRTAVPDAAPAALRSDAPAAVESRAVTVEPRPGRIERAAEPAASPTMVGPPVELAGTPDREALYARVKRALLEDDLPAAGAALDELRLVDPGSTRLAFLDAQLERAHMLRAATEAEAPVSAGAAETRVAAVAEPEPQAVTQPAQRRAAEPAEVAASTAAQPASTEAQPAVAQPASAEAQPAAAPVRRAADATPDPVPVAIAAAHAALDFGSLEAAEMLITESRWLGADETAMGELELRLDTLRESLRRERQALLLALGRERIRNGRFTVPENDSAVHYLATLRAENAAYPGLDEAVWDLTPRLVDDVRGAIGARDWAAAGAGLERLRRVGAPEGITAPLAVEIEVTRRQHDYLRVPAAPEEMELLRTRTPVYPRVAVRNEFEGWVDLQFVVDREGVPRALEVVDEQPAGVFSRAAIEAVERYRYAPFVRDGVTYERLVRVRVVFALD